MEYIVFGPCGFHAPVCMAMFVYRSLTQAGAANIVQTMTQFAKYFILPSFLLFWVFFIILEWAQISAFAKGMTPYPKWCWIFSLPIGMIIAKMFNIFGNHPWVNAIDCGWISVGNLWMFGGLLIMMRKGMARENKGVLKNNLFLYLTEFFAGILLVLSAVYFISVHTGTKSTEYVSGDYILTDDKAPVEMLGMQVIDELLIKDEVAYYKGIYDREGIRGLLNSI